MLLSAESLLSTPAERARRSAVVPAVPDVGDACSSYIARSAHPFLPAALMRAADGTIKSLAPAFVVSVNGKVSPASPLLAEAAVLPATSRRKASIGCKRVKPSSLI
jgi:hypothetical protein